jgi:branched-chain amino acid transport system substrate-binding protein
LKRFFIILLAIAVIGTLIFGGCTKKTTTTTTQTQTSTPTKKTTTTTTTTTTPHKVLKIGSVIGLNYAAGVEEKKWYDLFAKLINEQGGWKIGADTYDVEMIVYDSQNDPAKGKSYLEKLVLQDGVKFILGSPTNNAATDVDVTEPNKVICLGIDSLNTSADPKIQYYYTPNGMFLSTGGMYVDYKDMQDRGMKSYVSLKPDSEMGRMADGMFNAAWSVAAPDVKYLGTVYYDQLGTSDFGPVATKIMSMNPDVVDCNFATASQIYNALYDVGYKGTFIPSLQPAEYASVIAHCGKAYVEGWELGIQDPRGIQKDPEMLSYIDAYTKEYGEFNSAGCVWMAYWFTLKDAINATQSVDVDVVKAYLDNQPKAVKTLTGYTKLLARPDAGNMRTISGEPAQYMATVKDGVIVPYQAISVKDHYLATIMSLRMEEVYKAYWAQYGYPTFPADQTSSLKYSDLGITGHD